MITFLFAPKKTKKYFVDKKNKITFAPHFYGMPYKLPIWLSW